jgi:hypothetical protein
MKTIAVALAVGLVGMLIVPASIVAMNLNEQQLDKLVTAGVGICGGSLLLLFLVVGVVLAARLDERRRQRDSAWGTVVDAPRQSWQAVPQQPPAYAAPPSPPAYQLPAPTSFPQAIYGQHPQPAPAYSAGHGGSEDYDLMPEPGQDDRFRFAG